MDRARLKELFRACGDEPIAPTDARWVDLDAARGVTLAADLANELGFATRPIFRTLAAVPGTGVTSLFLDLQRRLVGEGFEVEHVSLASRLDLLAPVDEEALLGAMVAQAAESEPLTGLKIARVRSVRHLLAGTAAGAPSTPPSRQELLTALHDVAARTAPTVFLLDDLHRATGTLATQHASTQRLAETLTRLQWDGQLPVHVVCSAPLGLVATGQLPEARVLPALPQAHHAGDVSYEGLFAMNEVMRRRLPDEDLAGLSGRPLPHLRAQLLQASGGRLRDLMRLLQQLLLRSVDPTGDPVDRAIQEVHRSYRTALTEEDVGALRRVRATGRLRQDGEDRCAERLLAAGLLLPLFDGELWFHVHPAVESALQG